VRTFFLKVRSDKEVATNLDPQSRSMAIGHACLLKEAFFRQRRRRIDGYAVVPASSSSRDVFLCSGKVLATKRQAIHARASGD
jgi:hypothetical protein